MASTLHHFLPPLSLSSQTPLPHFTIRAGPRSNRGPLVKGRVLSKEAILAVQSLKRAPPSSTSTSTLSRLIKSDLIATLRELLRQGHCSLALQALSALRSDPSYSTDLGLYADVALALDRNMMREDIDCLIEMLEGEGEMIDLGDKKGLGRLLRAVIGAGRKESTVRMYRVMRQNGWEVDEYLGKVLSKGLRGFGEVELAEEVELVVQDYLNACLGRCVELDEYGMRDSR